MKKAFEQRVFTNFHDWWVNILTWSIRKPKEAAKAGFHMGMKYGKIIGFKNGLRAATRRKAAGRKKK